VVLFAGRVWVDSSRPGTLHEPSLPTACCSPVAFLEAEMEMTMAWLPAGQGVMEVMRPVVVTPCPREAVNRKTGRPGDAVFGGVGIDVVGRVPGAAAAGCDVLWVAQTMTAVLASTDPVAAAAQPERRDSW
jgi:hypothetical protein